MRALASQRGFTLMEMLIAVAITAVIGLGVWQVLNGVITARDRVDELAGEFSALQRTMLLLERDISQMINRPARDVYGDSQPALTSRDESFSLLLTRQGWRNPLGERRSSLQRVGWRYDAEELTRIYWPVLDQGQEDNRRELRLLGGVKSFRLRFLDVNRQWHDNWPIQEALAGAVSDANPINAPAPLGIELTFELERFGTLARTFALTDYDPQKVRTNMSSGGAQNASESDADGSIGPDGSDGFGGSDEFDASAAATGSGQ